MKKRDIILTIFSAFLMIIVLVGSTGVNFIIHDCKTCGISVTTRLFESVSVNDGKCCINHDSSISYDGTVAIGNGCCTITRDNLKISNYISADKIILSLITDINPFLYTVFVPFRETEATTPIFVHNKHGGYDIIITNCQLLI